MSSSCGFLVANVSSSCDFVVVTANCTCYYIVATANASCDLLVATQSSSCNSHDILICQQFLGGVDGVVGSHLGEHKVFVGSNPASPKDFLTAKEHGFGSTEVFPYLASEVVTETSPNGPW